MIILRKHVLLHKNIYCVYSLEVPWWGASNEYHNVCFYRAITEIISELSKNTKDLFSKSSETSSMSVKLQYKPAWSL